MSIRWITPFLGTAPALKVDPTAGYTIVDVRDLVDKEGNRSEAIREKVSQGVIALKAGQKTIICCDYGISRSNAVAVGVLATYEAISFEAAARKVMEATGENEIKSGPLNAVRVAMIPFAPKSDDSSVRVLITGSTGSLGKPISLSLAKQVYVATPNRQQLDLQLGSTQLDLLVAEEGITHILHLANPRVFTSNVALGETLTMLRNVIDVCVAHDVKLIYPSSWEIYSGYHSTHLIADEAVAPLPKGPYGETKYLCETMINLARRTRHLRCTILRIAQVYGVGCDKPKFIHNFLHKIRNGIPIVTHRYNNGLPKLDLLHIDDISDATIKALLSDFLGDLNLGTGILTDTNAIATMLADLAQIPTVTSFNAINSQTGCIAMDYGLANKLLDWSPKTDLRKGLESIIAFS